MEFKFNPFSDMGISNYEQFKNYPFLVFDSLNLIKSRVDGLINQMENNYFFQERLILVGDRGIGKTSTLFFIKDEFEKRNFRCEILSNLPRDEDQLIQNIKNNKKMELQRKGLSEKRMMIYEKDTFGKISEKPIFLLIDFPDSVGTKDFKDFLTYVWDLMTHRNYSKINLIFAMNKSHYDKSFSYGETFGKFTTLRIERLNFDSTIDLIQSRFNLVNKKIEDVFKGDSCITIFEYSKGIPRNIISACKLLIDSSNGGEINQSFTEEIFKEKYIDQVLNDRVEDLELKKIYKKIVQILKDDFRGTANSQEEFVKKISEVCEIGKNSSANRLRELVKFGVLKLQRGGYNRLNRIVSFN